MSHTGIDLESIEAVILFVIVRQDVNSALHKSPMRFFALYEFPYTSVLEMRPADELLCRCLYTPYVVVVVCCLEATALHCLVALCGCPLFGLGRSWLLAVFWAFFAFLRPDDATGCDVMGECEWTECEADWRFFCGPVTN